MFLRKRLTFGWCQMIDGSQLTRCCRITVVWVDSATITLLRRWSCCSSDDQRFASVMLPIPLSFLRRCPAVQLPTLLWITFDRSRILTDSVMEFNRIVNLSHSGDHWLSPVQKISFSSFVLSGRLGWRHGLIWPLIGWPYQCLWDAVLSWWNQWLLLYLCNDDVTLFIYYDCIQLLAYVTVSKQVI